MFQRIIEFTRNYRERGDMDVPDGSRAPGVSDVESPASCALGTRPIWFAARIGAPACAPAGHQGR